MELFLAKISLGFRLDLVWNTKVLPFKDTKELFYTENVEMELFQPGSKNLYTRIFAWISSVTRKSYSYTTKETIT